MTSSLLMPFGDFLHEHPEAGEIIHRLRRRSRLPEADLRSPEHSLEKIPGYLGSGVDKDAFRVGEHVLKLVHPRPQRPFEAQLRPMRKAVGVPGAEQLVSVSAAEGAMATDFVDGVQVMRLFASELVRYLTPERVLALIETMHVFQEKGLYVDSLSGIIATHGDTPRFTIIDPIDSPRDATNNPLEIMQALSQWKTAPGAERLEARSESDASAVRAALARALKR